MPATATVHMHWPTHDKELVTKQKIALDGSFKDDKAGVEVALQPGMSTAGATVKLRKETLDMLQKDLARADPSNQIIHLDVDKGIQIKYTGLKGWVGIDGRYSYAAKIGKDAADLQAGREEKKTDKFALWFGIVMVISIIGNIILAAMADG